MIDLGPLATCVHLWALSYSTRHLTDGHISRKSLLGCTWVAEKSQRSRVTRLLVRNRLWVEAGDGFDIIGWDGFLRKRADVLEERAKSTVRKQDQREREKAKRHGVTSLHGRDRHGVPDPTRTPLGVRGGEGPNASVPNGDAPNAALAYVFDSDSPPHGAEKRGEGRCSDCDQNVDERYALYENDDEASTLWLTTAARSPDDRPVEIACGECAAQLLTIVGFCSGCDNRIFENEPGYRRTPDGYLCGKCEEPKALAIEDLDNIVFDKEET